ncbi:MAG: hypothetical protein L0229_05025, partial [Blastocatellia bacterium]|nr:hypothetical protein [Blastocatellia bacterium]
MKDESRSERVFILPPSAFILSENLHPLSLQKWRRGWDSNPRCTCPYNAFRDLPIKPLTDSSKTDQIKKILQRTYLTLQTRLLLKPTKHISTATSPENGETPERLLVAADTALYRMKASGKGSYCLYHPEMSARIAERVLLADSLRRALGKGDLRLFFQPQV